MKKLFALVLLVGTVPFFGEAQVLNRMKKNVERTAERKVQSKVSQKTGEAVDEVFDKMEKKEEGKSKKKNESASTSKETTQKKESGNTTGTYNRKQDPELSFDGEILFSENFTATRSGDLPASIISSSGGEVIAVEDGKGLLLYPNSNYLLKKSLPENFALEFDLTLHNVPASLYNTYFNVYLQEMNTLKHNDSKNRYGAFGFSLWGDAKEHQLDVFNKKAQYEIKEKVPFDIKNNIVEQTARFVALVNGNRLRLFINGEKVVDSPELLSGFKAGFVNFRLNGTKKEEGHQFILQHIKITAIEKDLRAQLLEDGLFSTSNILFASGSAELSADSYELLRKIGTVLKEGNAAFEVVGHTDSDGDAAKNKLLSEQRAGSVKKFLVQQCAVPEKNLSVKGKGEEMPSAPNTTEEGKRKNRRVEFRKIQ